MRQINVKSDFDLILKLKDCRGQEIGWPDFDWKATIYTASPRNCIVAHCIGGVSSNCFNDGGRIHVVCKNHGLMTGKLHVEFDALYPDTIYPDELRREVTPEPLDVYLTNKKGDDPTEIEVELMLPISVITAYQTAVAAGFEGTQEDYYRGLGSLTDIAAMASDVSHGKTRLAEALAKQGVAIESGASFEQMAEAVESLQLAVEGEPGIVGQSWRGLPVIDLLNTIRNNQRTDLPYCWIARTADIEVTLTGAEGYLCSDGYYTTDSGVTHRIEREIPDQDNWVIYYYSGPYYVVKNSLHTITGLVVLNGYPDYTLVHSSDYMILGDVISYTEDLPPTGFKQHVVITGNYFGDLHLRGLVNLDNASAFPTANVVSFSFPDLEDCAKARFNPVSPVQSYLEYPKLTRLIQGFASLSNVHVIKLPSVVSHSSTENWNSLYVGNSTLREIHIPLLREFPCTQYGSICASGNATTPLHVYADSLVTCTRLYFQNSTYTGELHLHLGAIVDESISIGGGDSGSNTRAHLHLGKGFRSDAKLNNFNGTTHEELLELIGNLADNREYETKTISLGTVLLEKLSDDEIAMATEKNYTLT